MSDSLRTLQQLVYQEYQANDYLMNWSSTNRKNQLIMDLAEVGLFNTEVSEAMEALRDGNYIELKFELADIIIRVLNFASRKGIKDLGQAIRVKNEKNKRRGSKHGREV